MLYLLKAIRYSMYQATSLACARAIWPEQKRMLCTAAYTAHLFC